MFGNKLRSWMEAVRPKKKHQRKEKLKQSSIQDPFVPNVDKILQSNTSKDLPVTVVNTSFQTIATHKPDDNGANLSSPESAYSTGYSTDGTSPMGVPGYLANRTGNAYFTTAPPTTESEPVELNKEPITYSPKTATIKKQQQVHFNKDCSSPRELRENKTAQDFNSHMVYCKNVNIPPSSTTHLRPLDSNINAEITSPRQRNRIRTNPWVPASPCHSGSNFFGQHDSQDIISLRSPYNIRHAAATYLQSPQRKAMHYESSSCSSLSSTSTHWDIKNGRRVSRENSEEEDFTLNEMMGKYDESYVYEKETDILSDSDPTDGEIDTDTGEDCHSGREGDKELDFIDNDSYHDLNADFKKKNTGNCTYFSHDKIVVYPRSSRRAKTSEQHHAKVSSKRKKSVSARNLQKSGSQPYSRINLRYPEFISNCTRSAENTPISIRKTKLPISKLALNDTLKKRSNSVSFSKEHTTYFDQRDREATKKYKQLIVEAEHILNNMKMSTMSPKRLVPANKRVEILRTAESTKPEEFKKSFSHISKVPSNVPDVFAPRRIPYHLSNYPTSSPVKMRPQLERNTANTKNVFFPKYRDHSQTTPQNSPIMQSKFNHKGEYSSRHSPKYKRKTKSALRRSKENVSSDTETELSNTKYSTIKKQDINSFSCYSEPVKRKVYKNSNGLNLNVENVKLNGGVNGENHGSTSNLRQQIVFNTIANLKRNLEDQSASLKQSYRGSQSQL